MSDSHHHTDGTQADPDHPSSDAFERGSFLTVTGVIDSGGHLFVEPGFKIDYRRRTQATRPDDEAAGETMILEFLDEGRKILTQSAIPLAHLCARGGAERESRGVNAETRIFASSIRVPEDDYRFVRYYVGNRLLKEVARPSQGPSVTFVRTPDGSAGDAEEICWEVSHGEAEIRTVVLYSHDDGESWQAVVPPSPSGSNSVAIRFSDLPGGRARLKALATDGFLTAAVESAPFDVLTKGVRPSILGPADGTVVPAEATTWFHGQAYDYEKQAAAEPDLLWRSSRDGELGCGGVIAVRLSPGIHEITLACCDSEVSITVSAKPGTGSDANQNECCAGGQRKTDEGA